MWEDDRNKLGGRWLMTLTKQQRHNELDRYWMETVRRLWKLPLDSFHFSAEGCDSRLCHVLCVLQLLCLVGESFDEASEDVCGAVVNVRPKGDKIAIWTSNCQNRDAIMTIGYVCKVTLLTGKEVMESSSPLDGDIKLSIGFTQYSTPIFSFHRQLYKDRLNIPIKAMIGYQSHDDTSSKSGSTTKNMYSV